MRITTLLLPLLVADLCTGAIAPAEHVLHESGIVLDPETKDEKNVLYSFKKNITLNADISKVEVWFMTPASKNPQFAAVHEIASYHGHELDTYRLEQNQVHEHGAIDVQGGKVFFSYEKNGETKTAIETYSKNVIIADQIPNFIRDNWKALIMGDNIDARLAVASRRETVGFKFFKEASLTYAGKPSVVIKMKPTSVFISLLVRPVLFTFDPTGKELYEINGRMPVKKQTNGDWSDWDARLVFKH